MKTMKLVTCDIQKNQDARRISFIASHEKVDRDSELILVSGIDTSEFERNPILLLQHDQRSVAVGRVTNLRTTSIDGAPALVGQAVFPDRPQSDDALQDVRAGLLNSVSIGFRAIEVGPPQLPNQSGPTFARTKLLEISLVTLPACATCLVTQKSACRCDDILPPAPSSMDYSVDTLSHTLANGLAKVVASAAFLHLDEADVPIEAVNKILSKAVSAAVAEAVQREVRAKILYLSGRVD